MYHSYGGKVNVYSVVAHFAKSIRPWGWEGALVALLTEVTAYVDESGTDKGNPHIVVAGLLSDAARWVQFSVRWAEILRQSGVPYSHMKEFAHNCGPFAKWKSDTKEFESHRQKFLGSLCAAAKEFSVYSFGFVMKKADYEAYVPIELSDDMGGPYALLGRYCIVRIGVWADNQQHNEPVNLIFERGQPEHTIRVQHGIVQHHEEARKAYRLGVLAFGDKYNKEHPEESILPLQAADLIAYELLKGWKNLTANRPRPPRYPLQQLQAIPHAWNKLTVADIIQNVTVWRQARDRARRILTGES